jgi:hypothetical protein
MVESFTYMKLYSLAIACRHYLASHLPIRTHFILRNINRDFVFHVKLHFYVIILQKILRYITRGLRGMSIGLSLVLAGHIPFGQAKKHVIIKYPPRVVLLFPL